MSLDTENESLGPESYLYPVQALLMRGAGEPMRVETIHLKEVGPGDVRVRIDQAGVCHSDLSLFRGVLAQPIPAVLGHEACGTIVETGTAVTDLAEGQRVILLWITRVAGISTARTTNPTCAYKARNVPERSTPSPIPVNRSTRD